MNTTKVEEAIVLPSQADPVPDSSAQIRVTNVKVKDLSPVQKQHYSEIAQRLDVHDVNTISNYGSEIANVMSQNSNALLEAVRATNGNEVTALTTELLAQLNMIDVDELGDTSKWKKFLRSVPILKKFVTSIEQIMNKYDSIAETVENISKKIDATGINAKKDNTALQEIFDNNVEYIKQIGELIIAAQLKLDEVTDMLAEMHAHPDNYEVYEINDVQNYQHSLEKKISDMQAIQYTMKMNLLQVRSTQNSNIAIADKANTFVSTVLPVWKNQLSISIMMNNQKQNVEAQKLMTDTTNKILKKNAELMKLNSIAVAKESERGIIDLATLQETTNKMIETVKEVDRIHEEGVKQRRQLENDLHKLEETLNESVTRTLGNLTEKEYLKGEAKTFKELKGVSQEGSVA